MIKINIFEAARRISKIVAATWIIFWIVRGLDSDMQGNPIYFASVTFGGLFFILIITSVIGWIVRKFMGISSKKDRREMN
ncbi:hypothetical protein OAO51_02455 [Nitrosomonadaceae bacterium]|jgi:flagellar biogenesis protein FliO|nr:hypothetical protein [Nitrosomonadaceae bacterium]|tara:strand:+ start:366 stop:605 length:240 start_codon:yes stop_codon:yes gene_type:complete